MTSDGGTGVSDVQNFQWGTGIGVDHRIDAS